MIFKAILPFIMMWLFMSVLRLLRIRSYTSRTRQGPGHSSPWGGNPWDPGQRGQYNGQSHETKSPYEVLGVKPTVSRSELAARYRELVQQYHPDKVAHLAPEFREVAEQRMKEINAAYDLLKR